MRSYPRDNAGVEAILVFDGDCAFCTASASFTSRWIQPRAQIVPWQQLDLASLGLTAAACADAIQWVSGGEVLAGPAAAGAALRSGRWFWRPLGWLLRPRFMHRLMWPVYRLIARNRHRLPGGTAACALPSAPR
jgi:predicted DCC family thiol-disulfide oxidoreductase YuxK